jgi:hypothetical protein
MQKDLRDGFLNKKNSALSAFLREIKKDATGGYDFIIRIFSPKGVAVTGVSHVYSKLV